MEMKDFVIGIGRTNIDLIYSGLDRLPLRSHRRRLQEYGPEQHLLLSGCLIVFHPQLW